MRRFTFLPNFYLCFFFHCHVIIIGVVFFFDEHTLLVSLNVTEHRLYIHKWTFCIN